MPVIFHFFISAQIIKVNLIIKVTNGDQKVHI